jgi:ABC-type cobalamin/Fe3+-siderophores transport system ATPase subunit
VVADQVQDLKGSKLPLPIDLQLPGSGVSIELRAGMSTIIVGANGSGKTRLAMECERQADTAAHRISAQRMLALDPSINKIGEQAARDQLRFGVVEPARNYGSTLRARDISRWGQAQPAFILNDAGSLIQVLFAEQANVAVEVNDSVEPGMPVVGRDTIMRKLKEIFHRVLPTRRLTSTADDIRVIADDGSSLVGPSYSITEMSDGEKAVFYMIGQVLVADADSVLIMDEPEIHVHRAILGRLWDELEAARPDCAFLLITHDLEFAASRAGKKYVVRNYSHQSGWTIDEVPEAEGFSEDLVTLILGSRKPVLFVEGEQGSLDLAFYRACYPNWTVIPRGGCENVIHSVATMRRNAAFTRITCAGLVDADGRDEDDRSYLAGIGVSVLPVAEIENLLLLPDVSRVILAKNDFSGAELDAKLAEVKTAVFADAMAQNNMNMVVLGYCRRRIDQMLKRIDLSADQSVGELAISYAAQTGALDVAVIAAGIEKKIRDAIAADDLPALLAIYDRKKPLLALAARLRTGSVSEFTAWVTSLHRHARRAFRQFLGKAALVELGHGLAFQLVAFVQEGQPEGVADVAEDLGVLRPVQHRAGDMTVDRSPFMKAVRVRSATVTIWLIVLRPFSVL